MSKRQNMQAIINDYNALKQQHQRALSAIAAVQRAAEETIEEFTRRADDEIKAIQYDLSMALARLDQFQPHNDKVVEGILQEVVKQKVDFGLNEADDNAFVRSLIGWLGHAAGDVGVETAAYGVAAVCVRWLQSREERGRNVFNGEKAVEITPGPGNSSTSVDAHEEEGGVEFIYDGDDEPSYEDAHPRD